jgi:cytochrome c-type biogenesis protein
VIKRDLRFLHFPVNHADMAIDVSAGAALLAGAVSFLSPCVLPLVPPFLVYISGVSLDDMKTDTKASAVAPTIAFILGFTTVFVLLGATASYAGQVLRQYLPILSQIAGIFIIIMGLNFLGLFKLAFLSRDTRYQTSNRPAGLLGAYGIGLAFAFGWTPCIGPVLAAILSVAASEQSVTRGMSLLAIYSLGLGIPFLLSAMSVTRFLGFFAKFKHQLGRVEKLMGVLLVLTGILFLTGALSTVSYWLLDVFPSLGKIG